VEAVVDVFVVAAREVPRELEGRQLRVHVCLARQAFLTRAVAVEAASVEWHTHFRCGMLTHADVC
jgi:hypothetical protein